MHTTLPPADFCANLPDNAGMPPRANTWERLAEHVIARRVELGHHSRTALANATGLGLRTLGDIETARRSSYDMTTIAKLEQALHWEPGSVQSILTGGTPRTNGTITTDGATEPNPAKTDHKPTLDLVALQKIMASDKLDAAAKRRLAESLLAQARAFERSLEEQAAEMIRTFGRG